MKTLRMKPKFLVPALFIALSVMMVTSGAAIAAFMQSQVPTGPVPGKYIIVFKDGIDPLRGAQDLEIAHGLRMRHIYSHAIKGCSVSMAEWKLEAIESDPTVEYVEQDVYVHALQQTLPWGVDRIDAELVWTYNTGAGVKVAIIDTGIDYTHPDLAANFDPVNKGYDFVDDDDEPLDENGHGTHCAGIVAARDNAEGVVGVGPEAKLYAVRVLDRRGSGLLSDIIAGLDWSVVNGMQVISMSLGTTIYSLSLETACNNAYNAGLVLIAAAGNSGDGDPSTDEYSYPAAYGSVIAVGATDSTDAAPFWSNSGPYLELAAPGVSIYSTLPTYRVTLTTFYGYDYGTLNGTSMACPHVSGTAALVIASDPTLTNEAVRLLLQSTADDLGPAGLDTVYGYGLIDADEAASGEDTIPPTISNLTPADGSIVNTGTPTISATVADAGGIDSTSIVMAVDAVTVTHSYDSTTSVVSYTPTTSLIDGLYTVTLDVADAVGNLATTSWSFTVDTTPPEQVAGVTVTTVSSSQLDISWTANTELDLDHYNVYRSTTSGGPYGLVASPTTNLYSNTGLAASTTYYYVVTAVDVAGNEGDPSLEASGTTSEAAVNAMHIASITMSTVDRGPWTYAIATVTIVDATGNPVAGATVSGGWSGLTGDTDSGVTNTAGQISFSSDRVRDAEGIFTLTVTDVVHTDYTYDSTANVVTSASIEV
ncbi:MAG: S8 family serine peptidase [Deltaproteobacteria bacterium]|nr:S8 family serine peptidase [Deltaproteobacteria bacterium]